jgi:hypothetical protein
MNLGGLIADSRTIEQVYERPRIHSYNPHVGLLPPEPLVGLTAKRLPNSWLDFAAVGKPLPTSLE